MTKNNQFILGIIVDISSSMQKNWYNDFTRKESRIDVIRDSLNTEFQRLKILYKLNNEVEVHVFCLGIGFILPFKLISVDISDGKEKKIRALSRTNYIGVICDVIALSELVPSEAKMIEIKNKIQTFWSGKSEEFLADVKSDDEVLQKLKITINDGLTTTIIRRESLPWKIIKLFNKEFDQVFFKRKAKQLSENLANDIVEKSVSLFNKNKRRYEKVITEKLTLFANQQIRYMLERNALGFSMESIIENFDKNKLLDLADSIYQQLRKDISKEYKNIWLKTRLKLFLQKNKNFSVLKIGEVRSLTEDGIKSIGWKYLGPFVEQTALKIFAEEFEKVTKENFRDWLNLASKREVIRNISELNNLLPDSAEKTIYTSEYMFGGTPMLEAINLSSLRFLETKYKGFKKTLLVISDGEYDNEMEVKQISTLLKNQEVTIACGYIGNTNLIEKLQATVRSTGNKGVRNLTEIASGLDELNILSRKNNKEILKGSINNKLCVQINHPDNLTALINLFLDPEQENVSQTKTTLSNK